MIPQSLSFFSEPQNHDWHQIRGWLLTSAAEALHKYATHASPTAAFVEIGSFAGKSTVCLLTAFTSRTDLPADRRFTAIDLRFQPDFWSNLGVFRYQPWVDRISGPSMDAVEHWESPIGFLYIDGHHGKGYALADLMVWDPHLIPGAILALDDTAGFMVGPNLQIQAAVRTGAYDLLEEVGGISFLRKNHSILPISETPDDPGSIMAKIHVISANVGAFDPEFRLPRLPHQPMPPSEWMDRALHSSISELLGTLRRKVRARFGSRPSSPAPDEAPPVGNLLPSMLRLPEASLENLQRNLAGHAALCHTLDYLNGCFLIRKGLHQAAVEQFARLAQIPASELFHHYDLPIAWMAELRLGQASDLAGARDPAMDSYNRLLTDCDIPEIRLTAEHALRTRFEIKEVAENLLLRQYNLVLYRYKIATIGRYETTPA
jgi:MMP 1-O-methyltransferase